MSGNEWLTQKKAILFDLNGTLIVPRRSYTAALRSTLQDYLARWSDEDSRTTVSKSVATVHKAYMAAKNQGLSAPEVRKRRREALRLAVQPLPLPGTERFVRQLDQTVLLHMKRSRSASAGILKTLRSLHKHYKLGIITNGSYKSTILRLRNSGLAPYFAADHVICSVRAGSRKPDKIIFNKALDALGVKAQEAVMIGNCWAKDIMGAQAAGIDAIWISPAATDPAAKGTEHIVRLQHVGQLRRLFHMGKVR